MHATKSSGSSPQKWGKSIETFFSLQKLDMCEAGQGKERLQWQDGVGNIQVGNIQKEENS